MDYLPASVYQSPPRLVRGQQLNTIPEDNEEASVGALSDSEGVLSDATIIGRPAGLDAKYFVAKPRPRQRNAYPSSPQSVVSSQSGDEADHRFSARSSYTGSDAGTVFSEGCPSLTGSQASTTFASESSSVANCTSRKKFPSILIPRGSWGSIEGGEIKQIAFDVSLSAKIRLSPEALESLSRTTPAADNPPSLGDNSSVRSESPCIHAVPSLPVTPDMRNLEVAPGRSWGGHDLPLEIAIDEHHSILLSPAEAHSANHAIPTPASTDWTRMMGTFPQIPGATPQEMTPVTPDIPRGFSFGRSPVDNGVQLPPVALEVLENIARASTPSVLSETSAKEEMREHYVPLGHGLHSETQTPLSEYSYTRLSIPSPSGFFASLKDGARHTWCSPRMRAPSPPPSSTTAENFYNTPWNSLPQSQVVETVLHLVDDDAATDGPPTVKQSTFDSALRTPKESEDLYGGSSTDKPAAPAQTTPEPSVNDYEYNYEHGLKQAAEASIGRTSHWLAAQNTYLSALRETNPLNDPADYMTIAPCEDDYTRKNSIVSESNTADLFLHKANEASLALQQATSSPTSSPKEPLFLEAYNQFQSKSRRRDTFSQSAARLESIQSTRIALPKLHLKTLLNDCTSQSLDSQHIRPKYRGPFSQNPRATGCFARTAEQERFAKLERHQNALSAIMPAVWLVEAQRKILYNGRLFASQAADERLNRKSQIKTSKSRPRVLDLGGAATASWAWAVANKYPNAEVYTVQSTHQTELRVSSPIKAKSDKDGIPAGPLTPTNHHVVSVPHMWQLPFKSNHFDVISARSMHMYLRSTPVPAVESIDEWDMTLKECLRVLRPGGVLDFFVMDSAVSNSPTGMASDNVNISPSAMVNPTLPSSAMAKDFLKASQNEAVASNFRFELKKRGYDQDGGCSRLMARLKNGGFTGIKRQWIALPMGRSAENTIPRPMHSRNTSGASLALPSTRCMSPASVKSPSREPAYAQHFNADGTFKTKPFRLAPRPISEVSSVSKILDQYLNVEAVQGPVGTTNDVSDMCALLGELSYEEWIVRVRLESGTDKAQVLDGVHELFETWRLSGKAAWRGVVGWARKPTTAELNRTIHATSTTISHNTINTPSPQLDRPPTPPPKETYNRTVTAAPVLTIDTSAAYRAYAQQMMHEYSLGAGSLQRHVSTLSHVTQSAVERGDVGTIPMMIVK